MREIVLDAERMLTRAAAHEYLQKSLGFPDCYGKNLDALHDCLGELSDVRIVVRRAALLREKYGYGRRILSVLRESAEENPGLTVVEEDG